MSGRMMDTSTSFACQSPSPSILSLQTQEFEGCVPMSGETSYCSLLHRTTLILPNTSNCSTVVIDYLKILSSHQTKKRLEKKSVQLRLWPCIDMWKPVGWATFHPSSEIFYIIWNLPSAPSSENFSVKKKTWLHKVWACLSTSQESLLVDSKPWKSGAAMTNSLRQ